MHYRLEVIMPPTDDIEKSVAEIMEQFDENAEEANHAFYDWYVIGGRFAGRKLQDALNPETMKVFYDRLSEMKVTVSGIACGKQSLQPESQIPMVDALWVELFPDSGVSVCPIFSHSNDQYKSSSLLPGDVCKLSEMPESCVSERMIVAAPNYDKTKLEAVFMLQKSAWNGINYEDTTWSGNIADGVNMHTKKLERYAEGCKESSTPKDDWLVVTVDYHS